MNSIYAMALRAAALSMLATFSTNVFADGMQPATPVLMISENDGQATMVVTNTDQSLGLLAVTVEGTPEDQEPLLLTTTPLSRVEAGKKQVTRFILQNEQPLQVQRLRRVIFDGIPATKPTEGSGSIGVTVRQNIPAIISPKALPMNRTPWKGLEWRIDDNTVSVANDTPYVVRMAQAINLLGSAGHEPIGHATLPKTYILPGETLRMEVAREAGRATRAQFTPVNDFGFSQESHEAPIAAD